MPSITIDGRTHPVEETDTLLKAMREAGKTIPTLCHADHLPYVQGRCGLCLVEEQGAGLKHACQTRVEPNAHYLSRSPAVDDARRWAMRLILRGHPLECPTCPVEGRCRLQRLAMELGFRPVLPSGERPRAIDARHPLIHREAALCIRCGLCVSACRELQGANVLGRPGRDLPIATPHADPLEAAGCVSCGACLAVCPTGAIREPDPLAQETGEQPVPTTCGYCAVGCRLLVTPSRGRILRVEADPDGSVNHGHACVKGRFGHGFVHAPDRLTTPLIRDAHGNLQPADWETTLSLVAERFATLRSTHGPRSVGVVSSARCTNEENYLLQKFARLALGTNNIDNCARVCHSPSAFALGEALGTGAGSSRFEDIDASTLLMIVGANPTESHPVLGARIARAVRRGCRLIVIDPRRTELARMAHLHLPLLPGSNVAVINAMQFFLIAEDIYNKDFIDKNTEGFETLWPVLSTHTPEWAAEVAGIPAEAIRQAARWLAEAERGQILWGLGITEACQGSVAAFGLINLALLTGQIGRPGTGASPIRGQNNVQGACDMGALPNVLTDYQPVTNPTARARYREVWGAEPPDAAGMKLPEMLAAARAGTLRALYLVAQDPAQSDPDSRAVDEALRNLEFLVVQEIFPGESSRHAHVILPGACFFEKSGTFVNSDRRVQPVNRVIPPPGAARPDGEIVQALARRMGYDFDNDILEEIVRLSPNWGGIRRERVDQLGFLQWPCPHPDHPGTSFLHADGRFLRGRARLTPTPWQPSSLTRDAEFPLLLTTGRTLYHYNVGSMTRRGAIATLTAARHERARIHPDDAASLGIRSGDRVAIHSPHGSIEVHVEVVAQTRPGVVFLAFHFPATRTNRLVGQGSDTYTRCPDYKVTPVRIERVNQASLGSTPIP
ncbi:MAG: formate dehydrogenase subunit alpha [Magnetococcales bacterium]|nr:formate dehydrogenase subunit alpha [Magnetococcales bacterium]